MERVERAPDPRLRGVIHGYSGYLHEATGSARRREVAQAQVTILGFGPKPGAPRRARYDS
jgi:hypothetical protein